jgi:beta-glucuronidase
MNLWRGAPWRKSNQNDCRNSNTLRVLQSQGFASQAAQYKLGNKTNPGVLYRKRLFMIKSRIVIIQIFWIILNCNTFYAQSSMVNVPARKCTSLNSQWKVILDPLDIGNWREVWKERKPEKKSDFFEYSFEGGPVLNVPGDFNTQRPDLTYLEGTVWYKKTFPYIKKNKRLFLHFGAVNYTADVYLNGYIIGNHEGGFTPFQFEITHAVKEGENTIIVRVNNQRLKNGIPGTGYDWFNYGGITRDVNLVETENTFIHDYNIQLKKQSISEVLGWIKIDGISPEQKVNVKIPELGIDYKTQSSATGLAQVHFSLNCKLWSPNFPKLYKVIVQSETDTLIDEIGFRSIETKGGSIIFNGKPLFLKGMNIHEENPLKAARAWSESDDLLLLTWAKELGCNFVRLAHYPHNESMVRLAEKMGLLVWDEIPVYQHIEFSTPGVTEKIQYMMKEMISRDKNRCAVIIWSISNETYHFTPHRTTALIDLAAQCRALDSTRLITSVLSTQGYNNNTVDVWDTLYRAFDVISLNEYIGWYVPWQGKPKDTQWKLICTDKPVIISEFGGEALYGNTVEPKDAAASWSEEYQEQIYKDQIELFHTIPNLCGVAPWILVDFRSVGRMHPLYQRGWNRKGLLSDRGEKKKSWYVLKQYYDNIKNND